MWIYYNKNGELTTQIPHGEVIRQGSTFNLYIAIDRKYFSNNDILTLEEVKKIARENYLVEFKILNLTELLILEPEILEFKKIKTSEITYDLKDKQKYIVFHYVGNYNLIKNWGNYEAVLKLTNKITGESNVLGNIKIYVEKTYGDSNSSTGNVSGGVGDVTKTYLEDYYYNKSQSDALLSSKVDLTSDQKITGQKSFNTIYVDEIGSSGSDSKYTFGMENEVQMWTPNNKIRLTDTIGGDTFDYTFPQKNGKVVLADNNGNINLNSVTVTKGIVNSENSGFGFTDLDTPCIRNPKGRVLSMSNSSEGFDYDYCDYTFPDKDGTIVLEEDLQENYYKKSHIDGELNLQQTEIEEVKRNLETIGEELPTKVSDLENDLNYLTTTELETAVNELDNKISTKAENSTVVDLTNKYNDIMFNGVIKNVEYASVAGNAEKFGDKTPTEYKDDVLSGITITMQSGITGLLGDIIPYQDPEEKANEFVDLSVNLGSSNKRFNEIHAKTIYGTVSGSIQSAQVANGLTAEAEVALKQSIMSGITSVSYAQNAGHASTAANATDATRAEKDSDNNKIVDTYFRLDGSKKINGPVLPDNTATGDPTKRTIGNEDNKWNAMYAANFYGTLQGMAASAEKDSEGNNISQTYVHTGGGSLTGTLTTQNIIPRNDESYDLGNPGTRFNNIYSKTFIGNLIGDATSAGSATNATKAEKDKEGNVITETYLDKTATSQEIACTLYPIAPGACGLGEANRKFSAVYATNFYGTLNGSATTAETAKNYSSGGEIDTSFESIRTNIQGVKDRVLNLENANKDTEYASVAGALKEGTTTYTASSFAKATDLNNYLQKSSTDTQEIHGSIEPVYTNQLQLGSSTKKFAGVYANKFYGSISSADSATYAEEAGVAKTLAGDYMISANQILGTVGSALTAGKADIATTASSASKATDSDKLGGVAASKYVKTNDDGKIPTSYLPSYVDDVIEFTGGFPANGETGKIYVDIATNKTYRWSGSNYVEISASLALGETSSTAYAGDKGVANANAISGLNSKYTQLDRLVSANTLGISNIKDGTVVVKEAEKATKDSAGNTINSTYLNAASSGNKTFNGVLLPSSDNSGAIGNNNTKFSQIYATNFYGTFNAGLGVQLLGRTSDNHTLLGNSSYNTYIYSNNDLYHKRADISEPARILDTYNISGYSLSLLGTESLKGSIIPNTRGLTLGSANYPFNDIYADSFHGDLKGNADSATDSDKLGGVAASKYVKYNSSNKISYTDLPSDVNEVIEFAGSYPANGETGKIYVDIATNKTYRWSGSNYVEISASLALGETSSTAYAGDKGVANANAISNLQTSVSQLNSNVSSNTTNISGILTGAKTVVSATSAINDSVGNQINTTYLTKTSASSTYWKKENLTFSFDGGVLRINTK